MSKNHPLLPLQMLLASKLTMVKQHVFPETKASENPGSMREDPSKRYQALLRHGRGWGSG